MTPGQRKTMCRELSFFAAAFWFAGWLLINSDLEALLLLMAGLGIGALYRMGV